MSTSFDEDVQVLERAVISDDEDDDFEYEEVQEDPEDDDDDDDLADALASINVNRRDDYEERTPDVGSSTTQVRPSVVDDFVRNFLIKAGMKRTLDSFNAEWYELQSKGRLPAEVSTTVPDIYLRNDELDQQSRVLREQIDKMRQVAGRAQATWDKFRKERDFHRMHHKRVVQEKNKLLKDLKRVRNHLRSYEPMIEELKAKHQAAMKEKMLIKLERDRVKNKVKMLEDQIQSLTQPDQDAIPKASRSATLKVRKEAVFPPDNSISNPYSTMDFDPANTSSLKNLKVFKGHLNSISNVAFHPKKPIFATASDDETWRLWTMPDSELIMAGEGHSSWVSGLHFHPHGSHLASTSGDCTVKIWEFGQARCTHTFTDHTQAVWGCEFHHAGDFVASCSMDHTIRIWDLIAGKCRSSLRGHVDSVNSIKWLPFSNNVASASGDKTVSVWDARTGLCVQTLYGHANSVNDLCVTRQGETIVSCDADGVVKSWDIRMVAELGSVETGTHPLNQVSVDRSGTRVVGASDDGSLKIVHLDDFTLKNDFNGHNDAVQCVGFSPNDAYVVSGSSDASFKIWG